MILGCNKVIGSELGIAVGTVKTRVKAILQKLGAPGTSAARLYFLQPAAHNGTWPEARGTIPMTTSKVPSEDDPAQLPVEPEFPTDADPTNPHSDEGTPGADENAAGFVKEKL